MSVHCNVELKNKKQNSEHFQFFVGVSLLCSHCNELVLGHICMSTAEHLVVFKHLFLQFSPCVSAFCLDQ